MRKLTDEEKENVASFIRDALYEDECPEKPTDDDISQRRAIEDFTLHVFSLCDNDSSQIDSLFELCNSGHNVGSDFALAIWFDMWLNDSNIWPVLGPQKFN